MQEWEGFKKEGNWESRQRVGEEVMRETNGPLDTLWRRNLRRFPKYIERHDRTKEGVIRVIDGQRFVPYRRRIPDLVRCSIEQIEDAAGFSFQKLTINSAGRVWRDGNFEANGSQNQIEAEYEKEDTLAKITYQESFQHSDSPDTTKTFATTFTFTRLPSGEIDTVTCQLESRSMSIPAGLFEAIQTHQQVTAPISLEKDGILAETTAKIGEEFNMFGGVFYLLEDNPDGTIHMRIRRIQEEDKIEQVTSFVIQKTIADSHALLTLAMGTDIPSKWKEIVHSVILTHS